MTKNTASSARADLGWRPDLRSPLVIALTALLGLQLLFSLGLSLREPGLTALSTQAPLLVFTPDQVTSVRIEGGGEGTGVTLERAPDGHPDGHWVLADLADFPVAPSRVEQLLTGLAALKRPLPVATSEEARKRFKVAEAGFERRLTLEGKEGAIATLLLGDSPGFRRLFARPADDPAVYDLSLALSDVSARRDDWLDTSLLRLEQDRINRVASQDWTLIKDADGWRLEGSDRAVDQGAADDLARRLANLGYRGVLGTADDPAYRQRDPTRVLTIGLRDGGSRTYRISQAENSEDYVLKDADRPYYFKLSTDDLEGLLDLDADTLTVQPEASAKPNDG